MQNLGAVDAWKHTLAVLGGGNALQSVALARGDFRGTAAARRPGASPQSPFATHAHLAIVETCSDNVVSVSWSDPTSGRYSEQPWRLCTARRAGVCALTGEPIRRGDKVYRPLSRKWTPLNAGWAVLASALKQPV
jgi:hypothetical protein